MGSTEQSGDLKAIEGVDDAQIIIYDENEDDQWIQSDTTVAEYL